MVNKRIPFPVGSAFPDYDLDGLTIIEKYEFKIDNENKEYRIIKLKTVYNNGINQGTSDVWTATGEIQANRNLVFKGLCDDGKDIIYTYSGNELDEYL